MARLLYKIIQAPVLPPSPTPETTSVDRWFQPLSTPVRRPNSYANYPTLFAPVLPANLTAETTSVDRWFVPLSTPTRRPVSFANYPTLFAPVLPANLTAETTSVDRWFQPHSQPVVRQPNLGLFPTIFAPPVQPPVVVETVTVDKWLQPPVQPVRRPNSYANYPSVQAPPPSITVETTSVDRWFAPLSTPTLRLKSFANHPTVQAPVLPANLTAETTSVDRWFAPLSTPTRRPLSFVNYPTVQAPVLPANLTTETTSVDRWFVPLSTPTRPALNFANYPLLQAPIVVSTATGTITVPFVGSKAKPDIFLPINRRHSLARGLKAFFPIGPEAGADYVYDAVTQTKLAFTTGTPTWASMNAATPQLSGSDRVLKTSNSPASAAMIARSYASLPDDNAFCTIAVGFTLQSVVSGNEFTLVMQGGDNGGVASGGPYLALQAGNTLSGGASNNYCLLYRKVVSGTAVNTTGQGTVPVTNTYTSLIGEVGTNYAALFVNGVLDGTIDTTAYGTGTDGWNRTAISGFRRIAADTGSESDAKIYWVAMWNRKLSQEEKYTLHYSPFELFQQPVSYYTFAVPSSVTTETVTVDKWLQPLATPTRRLNLSATYPTVFAPVLPANLTPETTTLDRYQQPLSTPVRRPNSYANYPTVFAPVLPANLTAETTSVDRWFVPLSTPTRRPVSFANYPTVQAPVPPAIAAAVTTSVDQWHQPLSQPTRRINPVTYPTVFAPVLPANLTAETTSVDRWFTPLSTPTRRPNSFTNYPTVFAPLIILASSIRAVDAFSAKFGWESPGVTAISSTHNISVTNAEFGFEALSTDLSATKFVSTSRNTFGFETSSGGLYHFLFGLTPSQRTWLVPRDSLRNDRYRRSYLIPDRNYRIPEESRIWVLPSTGIEVDASGTVVVPATQVNVFALPSEFAFQSGSASLFQNSVSTQVDNEFGWEAKSAVIMQNLFISVMSAEFGFEAKSTVVLTAVAALSSEFGFEARSATISQLHRIAVNHAELAWEAKSATLVAVGGWAGTSTATSLNYYLGTYEGYHNAGGIGSTESTLGGRHLDLTCVFTPWDVSRTAWANGTADDTLFACQNGGNRAVQLTLHPWYSQGGSMSNGTSSSFDADYTTMINNIVPSYNTGNLKIIRIGQEFNVPGGYTDGGQFPWCGNPTAFKNIFVKLATKIRAQMPNVLIDWCPNIWHQQGGIPSDYYPGDAFVDIIGMDSYETNNGQGTGIAAWNAMVTATWGGGGGFGFQWQSDFAQTHNKKLAFAEVSPNPGGSSVYQAQAKLWAQTRPFAYIAWWNQGSGFDNITDGSNRTQFNSVWGSSSFSGSVGT